MGGMTQAVNSPATIKADTGAASFEKNLKRMVILLISTTLQKLFYHSHGVAADGRPVFQGRSKNESDNLPVLKRTNCSPNDEAGRKMFQQCLLSYLLW
jgi:hypothetical protein